MELCIHESETQAVGDLIPRPHPRFIEQAADTTRQGVIHSALNMECGLGSDTSISSNVPKSEAFTEHGALHRTMLLLEEAMTNPKIPSDIARRAGDVYRNLSFIGEKELAEAAEAIAEYWKDLLIANPSLSLFIITNRTFAGQYPDDEIYDDHEIDLGYVSDNKSDMHVLNHVLGNFTNEDLHRYGDRIILSAADLEGRDSKAIKTIVLDDWIMSGQQMQDTIDGVLDNMHPQDIEINLIISSRERLVNGFKVEQLDETIPVKAHFESRVADHLPVPDFGDAYLTAAHSSGDYPFESTLEEIVTALNETQSEKKFYMPPLANIIRPYYSPEYRRVI